MKHRSFSALIAALLLCAGCSPAATGSQSAVPTSTAATTPATTATTTAPTTTSPSNHTAAEPALPTALTPYSTDYDAAGENADLVNVNGTVYHAVKVVTPAVPEGGVAVGSIGNATDRAVTPGEHLQTNCAALVGQAVFQAGEEIYTTFEQDADKGDAYTGTVYRLWKKGAAVYEGVELDSYHVVRTENACYRRIYRIDEITPDTLQDAPLTTDALPADMGFARVGEIRAVGHDAPAVPFGSDIVGLGCALYGSEAYASFLYVAEDAAGFSVLVNCDAPLTCGSIRQEAGSATLDLRSAEEADIRYLASVLGKNTVVTPYGESLEAFGITQILLPEGMTNNPFA